MGLGYQVRLGRKNRPPLFATGTGGILGMPIWTEEERRAFVFTDASTGPYRKAEEWASAHADILKKKLPRNRRGQVHVVKVEL